MGSSPLARGLLGHFRIDPGDRGIIPARAGFTRSERGRGVQLWDHPRSRGVYPDAVVEKLADWGSSPLARGLPGGARPTQEDPGIIPARAGFTDGGDVDALALGDHPRSRGVYVGSHTASNMINGSSPLARGLLLAVVGVGEPPGIIPARAGFTCSRGRCSAAGRDHPRSRGVYCAWRPIRPSTEGSSPLARGLLQGSRIGVADEGIIPARAGFTIQTAVMTVVAWGSSPLARGLPPRGRRKYGRSRIIPARAGFTYGQVVGRQGGRDHPRSRGVYTHTREAASPGNGSSPLARGLQVLHRRRRRGPGIIPARAGFTPTPSSRSSPTGDHPRSRGVYRA